MFDDLRNDANSVYESDPTPAKPVLKVSAPKAQRRPKKILGMTAPQRFVLSFMLMLTTSVIGFMFLLVMGRIGF